MFILKLSITIHVILLKHIPLIQLLANLAFGVTMLVTDRFDCPARIARFPLCLGTFQHFILIIEHVMPVSGMSLFLSWTRPFPITCRVRARS